MSHYPLPPPPFGAGFDSSAPFTPYSGANLPGLPQYAYQPPPTTISPSSVQASNTLGNQHFDAYSFESNRQGAFTSSGAKGDTVPPFTALDQVLKIASHPATAHSAALPQYPPQSQNASPSIAASSNSPPDKLPHSQASQSSLAKPAVQSMMGVTDTAALSDLEDGELSDGDIAEKSGAPSNEVSHPSAGIHSYGEMNDVDIASDRSAIPVSGHQEGTRPFPGTSDMSKLMGKQSHSWPAQGQRRHPSRNGSLENTQPTWSSGMINDGTTVSDQKRQQAKYAVQLWYEQGHGFIKIAREGISSRLLEELYSEMGIWISPGDLAAAKELDEESAHNGQGDQGSTSTPPISIPNELPAAGISRPLSSDHPSIVFGSTNGKPRPVFSTNGVEDAHTVTDNAQPKKSGVQAEPASTYLSNTSANKSVHPPAKVSDKPYDRKDHIARLLAAKAGKTEPVANNPTSPVIRNKPTTLEKDSSHPGVGTSPIRETTTSLNTISHTHGADAATTNTQEAAGTAIKLSTATAGSENEMPHPNPTVPINVGLTDAETKKKAQTELARRKMEALMRRSNKVRDQSNSQLALITPSNQQVAPDGGDSGPSPVGSQSVAVPPGPQASPTPRSSFFSPTPGRQFSLPGLFMPSAPQPLPAISAEEGAVTESSQAASFDFNSQHPAAETANEATLPQALPSVPAANNGSVKSLVPETSGSISPSTEIVNHTRKRQKAADFIDAPSTRVKRLFGQNGDSSVVIEVSEDEALDSSPNDVDMDIDMDRDMSGTVRGKSIGSDQMQRGAPASQLPKRNHAFTKSQTSVVAMTPPVVQASGKETNGLKSKEMAIELLKRSIAEKEQQRRIAKQSTSRAQTPSPLKVSSPLRGSRASSEVAERSRAVSALGKEVVVDTDQATEDGEAVDAMGTSDSVAEERLLAEQQLSDVQQQRAHEIDMQRQSVAEQQGIRRLQQEQGEIEDRRLRERSEQPNLEQDQSREREEQRLRELEREQAMQFEERRKRQLQEQQASEVLRQRQERETAEKKETLEADKARKIQRRAAIEAGLPVLDAEVEKTEQKLQCLRSQIQELEFELQRGIDGRRSLVEELEALSPEPGTPVADSDKYNVSNEAHSSSSDGRQDSYDIDQIAESTSMAIVEPSISNPTNDGLLLDAAIFKPSVSALSPGSSRTSNGDLVKDRKDISKNDLDEGEISEYSPQSINTVRSVAHSADGEDVYEPPTVVSVQQLPHPTPSQNQIHQEDTYLSHLGRPSTESAQGGLADNFALQRSMQNEELGNSQSQSVLGSDMEESDGYEPPEPVSSAESLLMDEETMIKDTQSAHGSLASDGEQPWTATEAAEDQPDTEVSTLVPHPTSKGDDSDLKHDQGHYTPYESPLKYFKSYRYHRCFPDDVADGFRSLTYSHNIKPEEPICPFEIGGTCNDQSCPYQHFRNMNLSDNMILLQLGTAPAGLNDESQNAYNEGLRNVIRDIRSRNVRDFNAMAADITAYRANFIGDKTRVLPL